MGSKKAEKTLQQESSMAAFDFQSSAFANTKYRLDLYLQLEDSPKLNARAHVKIDRFQKNINDLDCRCSRPRA